MVYDIQLNENQNIIASNGAKLTERQCYCHLAVHSPDRILRWVEAVVEASSNLFEGEDWSYAFNKSAVYFPLVYSVTNNRSFFFTPAKEVSSFQAAQDHPWLVIKTMRRLQKFAKDTVTTDFVLRDEVSLNAQQIVSIQCIFLLNVLLK